MFDISWTEFLLIGVVALIVIGPKELPAVLRTLGQWTRKVRSMAADFQGQFQEAMREAEMADLKKQVDDIAHDVKSYDPLKDVRADVEAAGKDIKSSLEQPSRRRSPRSRRGDHCRRADARRLTAAMPASDAVATARPGAAGSVDESAPPCRCLSRCRHRRKANSSRAGIGPATPEAAESVRKARATGRAE